MSKKQNLVREFNIEVQGQEINVCQVKADAYGNPRYVVHFTDLGINLAQYDSVNKLYGFSKYRAKWYGGGIVFQSYNIEETIKYALDKVQSVKDSDKKFINNLSKKMGKLLMP